MSPVLTPAWERGRRPAGRVSRHHGVLSLRGRYPAAAGVAGRAPGILEAGCGGGRVLRALADRGYQRLVGLEISPQRLEQVRRRGPSCAELVCNQGFPLSLPALTPWFPRV